jgi:hypothetical protein
VKSNDFYRNLWKSMKMHGNLWTSLKIHVVLWKFLNIYRIYLFWEKKMGYILYSKKINASHMCPPRRNILFAQGKWKSGFSGKTWTLICKTRVKVTLLMKTWNDPTVITVILPQPVWLETPIKVQFLTKVLKVIFSKVWGSVWGLYSTI